MMKTLGLYTHTHTHTHTHTGTLNEILRNEKGITLVVLVVTIIVLLILAGISIQAITHTGIFSNAKQAELENKRGQVLEYLKLKLINEQTNNPFGSAEEIITATRNNVLENIEELKKIGKEVTVGEISTEEDFKKVDVYFYVIVDGDLYKVELNGVSFIGKIDEMPPVINMEKITNTTNSITVEVTAKRNEGGKLEYYIKSEDEEEYRLIKTSNEESYTYEGLEQGKKYSVKVRAVAKNTKTAEVIGEQETGKIVELTTANAKFTYSPNTWTNGDIVATVTTDVTGFTIQTSLDGQNWSNTASQTMSSNGPVYSRLWDGTNAGGMLTGNVTKIDKTKPVLTQVTPTTNSIRIIATDEQSGIVGYAVTTTTSVPTSFTSVTNTKKLDVTVTNRIQNTAYYVWVKDLVGNVNEVKKVSTGIVSGLTTANARFTYSPSSWTNGNVVATASTNVAGFTIQTSLDGKNWSNTPSQTRSTNGPVYARLWDGVNAGGMLTGSVTNIDKNKPAISRTITQGDNGMSVGGAYTNGEWAYYWRTCYLNVRFTCSDNVGITGYYWGTTRPTSVGSVSWTPVSSVTSYSIAKTIGIVGTAQPSISRSETYYFAVRDAAGNFEVNTTSTYEQCVYHKTVAPFTTSYKALANPGGYKYFVASFVNSGTTMYYTYGGVTSSVREAGVGNILTVNGGNAQICFSGLPGVNTSYYYIYFK